MDVDVDGNMDGGTDALLFHLPSGTLTTLYLSCGSLVRVILNVTLAWAAGAAAMMGERLKRGGGMERR